MSKGPFSIQKYSNLMNSSNNTAVYENGCYFWTQMRKRFFFLITACVEPCTLPFFSMLSCILSASIHPLENTALLHYWHLSKNKPRDVWDVLSSQKSSTKTADIQALLNNTGRITKGWNPSSYIRGPEKGRFTGQNIWLPLYTTFQSGTQNAEQPMPGKILPRTAQSETDVLSYDI